MGITAGLSVAGYDHLFFKRKRGGHDLCVNRPNRLFPEWPLALRGKSGDKMLRAIGHIDRAAVSLLDAADFLREAGAVVEQLHELAVDRIDRVPEPLEFLHG